MNGHAFVEYEGKQLTTTTYDIAAAGMALWSPVHQVSGCAVRVNFTLPGCEGLFSADAILVREARSGAGYLWGLRFRSPQGWVARGIETYVHEQLLQQAHERNCPQINRGAPARGKPAEPGRADGSAGPDAKLVSLYKAALEDLAR